MALVQLTKDNLVRKKRSEEEGKVRRSRLTQEADVQDCKATPVSLLAN